MWGSTSTHIVPMWGATIILTWVPTRTNVGLQQLLAIRKFEVLTNREEDRKKCYILHFYLIQSVYLIHYYNKI